MIYKITEEKAKNHPFMLDGTASFYRFLFGALTGLDYDTHCGSIDCRKINVAMPIQDLWYESAADQGIGAANLTILLAINGPKTDGGLTGYQVEILPDAIEFKDASGTAAFVPGVHDDRNSMAANGVFCMNLDEIMKELTPKQLADRYDADVLLNAFIIQEVEFRLREIHHLPESKLQAVKGSISAILQHNSDVMFNYDKLDQFLEDLLLAASK